MPGPGAGPGPANRLIWLSICPGMADASTLVERITNRRVRAYRTDEVTDHALGHLVRPGDKGAVGPDRSHEGEARESRGGDAGRPGRRGRGGVGRAGRAAGGGDRARGAPPRLTWISRGRDTARGGAPYPEAQQVQSRFREGSS